tara:strand:- start:313 stop:600 length:288 start_codon:yes stop_codon:yes gene_type:complete
MSTSFPIFSIAKELNIDSNRVLLACKTLGIVAKGAAKKLNKEELEKVKNYFEKGKNASQEIIDLNKREVKTNLKSRKIKENTKITYFANRLIRKS